VDKSDIAIFRLGGDGYSRLFERGDETWYENTAIADDDVLNL
jgi:hypothetical protein